SFLWGELDELIYARSREFLQRAIWPPNLDRFNRCCGSQSKMHAKIVAAQIAVCGSHWLHHSLSIYYNGNFRAYGIAMKFWIEGANCEPVIFVLQIVAI